MPKSPILRNPTWAKDELILALDLYLRIDPKDLHENNKEVIALGELLNELPIHMPMLKNRKFRNAIGVHMKLRNFIRFDDSRSGRGLQRGGKIEEIVWREFAADRAKLRATAQAIKENYKAVSASGKLTEEDEEESFSEGRILSRVHRLRERNVAVIKKKKDKVWRETGNLACDVCDFDFAEQYGDLGRQYAECHHTTPLSALKGEAKTKLSDLAIVCANCHRMLHRSRVWLSIAELKQVIARTRMTANVK